MAKYVSEIEVEGEVLTIRDKELSKKDLTELVVLGDSFTTGFQNPTSYLPAAQRIPNIFAKNEKLNLHNYGVNASGYTIAGNSFSDQADRAILDTALKKDKVKYVAIVGGINDINDNPGSNVASAADALRKKLYAAFPNCKVLQFPNWGGVSFNTFASWNVINQLRYSTDTSCVYVYPKTALCLVGYYQYVNADNIHPTADGAKTIAKCMSACLHGSYYQPHIGSDWIHPTAKAGWNTDNLTVYMTEDSIGIMGFARATSDVTAGTLEICELPAPFTFPVAIDGMATRSDSLTSGKSGVMVTATPPITLTSAYTVGKIAIFNDAGATIAAGTNIFINMNIPRLPMV